MSRKYLEIDSTVRLQGGEEKSGAVIFYDKSSGYEPGRNSIRCYFVMYRSLTDKDNNEVALTFSTTYTQGEDWLVRDFATTDDEFATTTPEDLAFAKLETFLAGKNDVSNTAITYTVNTI